MEIYAKGQTTTHTIEFGASATYYKVFATRINRYTIAVCAHNISPAATVLINEHDIQYEDAKHALHEMVESGYTSRDATNIIAAVKELLSEHVL